MCCYRVRCHLCHCRVPSSAWEDGSHRDACAKRNELLLAQLPAPFDVRCNNCLAYLKLMPKVSDLIMIK